MGLMFLAFDFFCFCPSLNLRRARPWKGILIQEHCPTLPCLNIHIHPRVDRAILLLRFFFDMAVNERVPVL